MNIQSRALILAALFYAHNLFCPGEAFRPEEEFMKLENKDAKETSEWLDKAMKEHADQTRQFLLDSLHNEKTRQSTQKFFEKAFQEFLNITPDKIGERQVSNYLKIINSKLEIFTQLERNLPPETRPSTMLPKLLEAWGKRIEATPEHDRTNLTQEFAQLVKYTAAFVDSMPKREGESDYTQRNEAAAFAETILKSLSQDALREGCKQKGFLEDVLNLTIKAVRIYKDAAEGNDDLNTTSTHLKSVIKFVQSLHQPMLELLRSDTYHAIDRSKLAKLIDQITIANKDLKGNKQLIIQSSQLQLLTSLMKDNLIGTDENKIATLYEQVLSPEAQEQTNDKDLIRFFKNLLSKNVEFFDSTVEYLNEAEKKGTTRDAVFKDNVLIMACKRAELSTKTAEEFRAMTGKELQKYWEDLKIILSNPYIDPAANARALSNVLTNMRKGVEGTTPEKLASYYEISRMLLRYAVENNAPADILQKAIAHVGNLIGTEHSNGDLSLRSNIIMQDQDAWIKIRQEKLIDEYLKTTTLLKELRDSKAFKKLDSANQKALTSAYNQALKPEFVKQTLDFAIEKADSLVSEERLKDAQKLIDSGKATDKQKADIKSKQAQTKDNVSFSASLLSKIIAVIPLTDEQNSRLTYTTQTLINRITDQKIFAEFVKSFGQNFNVFPEKVRTIILAQIVDRMEYIKLDNVTFNTYIKPILTQQYLKNPQTALKVIPTEVLAQLARNSDEVKKNLITLSDTWSRKLPDDLSLATTVFIALKKNNIDNDNVNKLYDKLFDAFITPETAKNPVLKKSAFMLLNYTWDNNYTHITELPLQNQLVIIAKTLNFLAQCTPNDFINEANIPTTWQSLTLTEKIFFRIAYEKEHIPFNEIVRAAQALTQVAQMLDIQKTTEDAVLKFKTLIIRGLRQAFTLKDEQGVLGIDKLGNASIIAKNLLNASINYLIGDPVFQNGLVSFEDVYLTSAKSGGSRFGRHEMLGETEQTLLSVLDTGIPLSTEDLAATLNALRQQINTIKDSTRKVTTVKTKEEVTTALDSFLARLDVIEALQRKNLSNLTQEKLAKAFEEFPVQPSAVFGISQGPFQSFAQYFINKALPEILHSISDAQAKVIFDIFTDSKMLRKIPVEVYSNLMQSDNMRNLINRVGPAAKEPLSNLLHALDHPENFSRSINASGNVEDTNMKQIEDKAIAELKSYIPEHIPRPIASTSKETAL